MIDFHTHVLPGIDDGASTVWESLSLLQTLAEQGVDTVLLSSHYYGRRRNVNAFLAEYERVFAKLKAAYAGNIRLVRACECNVHTCANRDFTDLKALCIEGTRYLLTELSFAKEWDDEFWERIDNLFLAGMIPVVAHVELYPAVQRRPEIAYRLVKMGCVLQVNCDSILDKRRAKLVDLLLGHKLISCIGSDAHNLEKRPPHYGDAIEKFTAEQGEAAALRLQENMRKILKNEEISQEEATMPRRGLFRYN